jgi:hypothetical protein
MRRFALSLPLLALAAAVAFADDDWKKLVFDTPKEWKEVDVKGATMAPKKEWSLEKAEGDDEAPSLKLYHFGGSGGTLDENVKRWCSQFKTKDGEAFAVEKAKKETFEVGDLKITTVEIEGTYQRPAMMGGGDPKKDQKLLAAYVDGKGGPWFIKLQGPAKSVDKNKDAFVKWLKSAKLEGKKEK